MRVLFVGFLIFYLIFEASPAVWSECFTTGVDTFCRGTNKEQVGTYFRNTSKISTSLSWFGGDLGEDFDLSDLDVEDFSLVNEISLKNNSIRSIKAGFLSSFSLLDTFSIQVNPIERLPSGLFDKTHVRNVLIRRVPLQSIDQGVFDGNKFLELLTIENSHLNEINANTFVNLPKLKKLEVSGSSIDSIDRQSFMNVPNLQLISLRFNNLTTIDKEVFLNVPNLQELNLEGNHLDHLDDDFFENLPQITSVHLNSNNLISFTTCKSAIQLRELDLSDNVQLKLTPFSNCDHLQVLGLAGLNLQNLNVSTQFAQTGTIQSLNLARNQLTNLDISSLIKILPNLNFLNLEKNPWNCNNLNTIKTSLDQIPTIQVTWGSRYYDIDNIDGIPCNNQSF